MSSILDLKSSILSLIPRIVRDHRLVNTAVGL